MACGLACSPMILLAVPTLHSCTQPWCGHCKRLAPTWEELAHAVSDNSLIKIATVDCTAEKKLCEKAEVCKEGFRLRGWVGRGTQTERHRQQLSATAMSSCLPLCLRSVVSALRG